MTCSNQLILVIDGDVVHQEWNEKAALVRQRIVVRMTFVDTNLRGDEQGCLLNGSIPRPTLFSEEAAT